MVNKNVCQECGQELENPMDYHTYESCLLYKLNVYRKSLGKEPIVCDIEAEDKRLT